MVRLTVKSDQLTRNIQEYTYKTIESKDLLEAANLFTRSYNNSEWKEHWDINIALNRLKEFFSSDYDYGIGCYLQNKLIGVLIYELSSWDIGKQCEIKEMFVDPAYRRKGIGKGLVSTLEEQCSNKNVVSFTLWTANYEPLIAFYSKLGYKINFNIIPMKK